VPPAISIYLRRQPSTRGDDGVADAAPDQFTVDLDDAAFDAALIQGR
jgi:hypothetical protein